MNKAYKNVFEAIEDDPVVAENMRLRAKLMVKLRNYIKQQGMTQEEAAERIGDFLKEEPTLSLIPSYMGESKLRVRHGGYDIRSAETDPNVTFPLSRLRDLVADGVIGDLAAVEKDGQPVPGVAPAAMQMGRYAGDRIRGKTTKLFRYRDKGSLATIGRSAGVADFGRIRFSGFPAWAAWLGIHIFFLKFLYCV